MSGAPATAGDFEESGSFEESQSRRESRTAGSYGDDFEGEAEQPAAAPPEAEQPAAAPPEAPRAGGQAAEPARAVEASPAEAAASSTGEGAFLMSGAPGSLHVAAGAGGADSVRFLLRNGADPAGLDSDGRTALQVAEAAGSAEVCRLLREEPAPGGPRAAPAAGASLGGAPEPDADADVQDVVAAAEHLLSTSPLVSREGTPAFVADQSDSPKGGPKPAKSGARPDGMSKSASAPSVKFGTFEDMKRRTAQISDASCGGVKAGQTNAHSVAGYKASPKFRFGTENRTASFIPKSSTPAPNAYNAGNDGTLQAGNSSSKYLDLPKFSIGRSPRFGTAAGPPSRRQPGPGAYTPKPVLAVPPKVGFGSSMRLKGGSAFAQSNPGPGAYEKRSTMGEGLTYTARGRHPLMQQSRSQPGPGAYSPTEFSFGVSGPRCGFGTSRRAELTSGREIAPGPGAFDLQNFRALGTDSPKFSVTSRRRMIDIDSYMTPGPGSYNSQVTTFGGP